MAIKYLPSIYDPKKIQEGILEIYRLVEELELNDKAKSNTLEDKEITDS